MTKLDGLSSSTLLNGDTDAQRGKGTSPKSHSQESHKRGNECFNCAFVKSEGVRINGVLPGT